MNEKLPEDRNYEDSILCPWCGYDNGTDDIHDSCELECCECGKSFHVELDYEVSYSTTVVLEKPDAPEVLCQECGERFETKRCTGGKIPYHFADESESAACEGSHEAPRLIENPVVTK